MATGRKPARRGKKQPAAQKAARTKTARAGIFEFNNTGSPLDGRFRLESPVGHVAWFDDHPIQPGSLVRHPHLALADSVRLIISTAAGTRLVFEHYYPSYLTLYRIELLDNNARIEAELAIP